MKGQRSVAGNPSATQGGGLKLDEMTAEEWAAHNNKRNTTQSREGLYVAPESGTKTFNDSLKGSRKDLPFLGHYTAYPVYTKQGKFMYKVKTIKNGVQEPTFYAAVDRSTGTFTATDDEGIIVGEARAILDGTSGQKAPTFLGFIYRDIPDGNTKEIKPMEYRPFRLVAKSEVTEDPKMGQVNPSQSVFDRIDELREKAKAPKKAPKPKVVYKTRTKVVEKKVYVEDQTKLEKAKKKLALACAKMRPGLFGSSAPECNQRNGN